MSARLIAVLRCDHEGCDERFVWNDKDGATWKPPRLTDARRLAHADGWRHGVRLRVDSGVAPTFDFCPDHAADIADYREVTP